jgi:hypothetical protein
MIGNASRRCFVTIASGILSLFAPLFAYSATMEDVNNCVLSNQWINPSCQVYTEQYFVGARMGYRVYKNCNNNLYSEKRTCISDEDAYTGFFQGNFWQLWICGSNESSGHVGDWMYGWITVYNHRKTEIVHTYCNGTTDTVFSQDCLNLAVFYQQQRCVMTYYTYPQNCAPYTEQLCDFFPVCSGHDPCCDTADLCCQ